MQTANKKIFIIVVAVLLVFGTLILDINLKTSKNEDKTSVEVVEKGSDAKFEKKGETYSIKSGSSKMILVLNGNALFRLDKGTSATIKSSEKIADVAFENGRIWINTLNSGLKTQVATKSVKALASPGVFDALYKNNAVTFSSFRHNLELLLLGNKLMLPESRQIVISENKLKDSADKISKLRYAKLLKEFSYSAQGTPDDWISQNLKQDEVFANYYKEKVENNIRDGGPVIGSDESSFLFKLGEFLYKTKSFLTFDADKKQERQALRAFEFFDAAAYAVLIGNQASASKFFAKFAEKLSQNSKADALIAQKRFDKFNFAKPTDSLFEAKTKLRIALNQPILDDLKMSFDDVLDTAAVGSDAETKQKVITSLRNFQARVSAGVESLKDPALSEDIFFLAMVFNDFLSRNQYLLREEFLQISEALEKSHLDLISVKEQADDQRQFFIAERIQTIKTIKAMLDKGDVQFQDARKAIVLSANQIDALEPAFSDSAVLAYFEDQKKEFAPFVSFLRSSAADNVRGSFEQSFKDFQTNIDEIKKITELLSSAQGGEQISAFRREELAGIVAADLGSVGVSKIKITLPASEGDPRVNIVSAEVSGKSLTAVYDTARKILSDISLDKEKIPNSIRLSNFEKFILVKTGKEALPEGVTAESLTEAPSKQTVLEKVTKSTLTAELKKLNIFVEDKYIGTENLNDGILHIRLALLGEGSDAKVFSFDVSEKASLVSNLKVSTVSGDIPVNGEFALRELPPKVEQIYQRAILDKQKEEELKKFVNRSLGTSTPQ